MLAFVGPFCVAGAILAFFTSQIGKYMSAVRARTIQQQLAKTFLMSETCTNPHVRAALAGSQYSLCTEAEEVLLQQPLLAGLFDVADSMTPCGENRCYIFYRDLKSSLPTILVISLTFAVLLCWCGNATRKYRMEMREYNRYQLPAAVD
jgi:hypothetical protein